jgi:hypothetical protein
MYLSGVVVALIVTFMSLYAPHAAKLLARSVVIILRHLLLAADEIVSAATASQL